MKKGGIKWYRSGIYGHILYIYDSITLGNAQLVFSFLFYLFIFGGERNMLIQR